MLLVVSTPATFIVALLIKSPFTIILTEEMTIPLNGNTIRQSIYSYKSGKPARIEYHRFDGKDWTKHPDSFYKDSTWIYFSRSGDTAKIEVYKHGHIVRTIDK